jgi:hypothetical protein
LFSLSLSLSLSLALSRPLSLSFSLPLRRRARRPRRARALSAGRDGRQDVESAGLEGKEALSLVAQARPARYTQPRPLALSWR